MKQSKYIGKYDYIDLKTKQESFLFHTNAEIISSIDAKIKAINSNDSAIEEDEYEEMIEIDSLNYYHEAIEKNINIDNNNPKIIEGNILDTFSKEYIKEEFSDVDYVFDFDLLEYSSLEQRNQKTLELLNNNECIIIFQPVFINGDLITKCDALVKKKNNIKIIETKGTSTAKLHHFLDLFFQYNVLLSEELIKYQFDFYLCIVDYVKANKNECPFVITPYINYSKTVSKSKYFDFEQWRKAKQGYNFTLVDKEAKLYEEFPISITNLVNGDFSDLESKLESTQSPATKKALEKAINLLRFTIENFDYDINLLKEKKLLLNECDQNGFINDIVPSYNDNGDFKKPDYWLSLRKLYQYENYEIFKYSGNVVYQTGEYLQEYEKNNDICNYFKPDYYDLFFSNNNPIIINRDAYNELLSKLKLKKVYFDFETINIATRVLDNTLPFMQIITQCSIIKDHSDNNDVSQLNCNNIVIDPLNIQIEDFKKIIDELYCGPEYSYIVYNKSFESSRLKEMIEYINEESYAQKINVIRENLFDLADFFTLKKEKTPIFIKEFGGFYSIKKVLPFIENNHSELFEITNCKDYKKLNVTNGLDCQNKTTIRFFNMMCQEEWEQLKKDISIYCENDVRAMIAVELLVKKLGNIL